MRQYRSNQGRSPKKETESMKVIAVAAVLLVLGAVVALIADLIW